MIKLNVFSKMSQIRFTMTVLIMTGFYVLAKNLNEIINFGEFSGLWSKVGITW